MSIWSLDLGSANSAVARWDESGRQPQMIELESICRKQETDRQIEVKYSVPSSVLALEPSTFKDRLGTLPFIEKRWFMGRRAHIGRQAHERNHDLDLPEFAQCFKPFLIRDSYRTLARSGGKALSARMVAQIFMRELFAEIQRTTGERPRDLTIGTPVDCYEPYRAQLTQIAKELGVHKVRFIDEPVAAALGYGLSAGHDRPVLVIDFGAGTLDLALITMDSGRVESGRCLVVAKEGASVGGNQVDSWLLEAFCQEKAFDLKPDSDPKVNWWYRLMLEEARAVKERLFFTEETHFYREPPESLQQFEALLRARIPNISDPLPFTRKQLVELLEERGLYRLLDDLLDSVIAQAESRGIPESALGEVLLVGGSTLLPGVYKHMENRFGRDAVRAWQPFHAVAYGGCVFASGHFSKSDFITHDYAFMTYHPKTHEPQYQTIIPKGTSFPSPPDVWKRQLTPTCALGEPEKVFKLVICELGSKRTLEQEFVWDPSGQLHALDGSEDDPQLVIPLNEDNPTLGFLDPPHLPGDKSARLEIGFSVNEERWLVARVLDLKTRRLLINHEPVVRIK